MVHIMKDMESYNNTWRRPNSPEKYKLLDEMDGSEEYLRSIYE